ncbi:hypothetical protein BB558_006386, partial [Smittium angustum]
MNNGANLESLTDDQLFKMVVRLPISFPIVVTPMRLPEFYYKMKKNLYPDYLYYALIALGNAASKRARTIEEKEKDNTLIQKSVNLLKLKTDIRDPYYLWACVIILNYFSTVVNTSAYETISLLASMSVKISKVYQLDLSKVTKLKYSEEELEFRRRVFWCFYASER